MARYSASHVPTYRLHKKSGQAVVTIGGRDRYLGKYSDDPNSESRKLYRQTLIDWNTAGRNATAMAIVAAAAADPASVTVEEVIAAFWAHVQNYYRDADGNPTSEVRNFADALRTLRKLYGKTPAALFSPKALKACQADMIHQGLARNTINRRISRIKQLFSWAVSEELLPPAIVAIRTVKGLKRGRSDAKETAPIKPVSEDHARAAMKHASRHIAAMIELQLITGMRSGEMTIMRTGDIDRTGPVWVYTPSKHKTQHHGHDRIIYLGQRAQAIVTPFLKMDPTAYIFSPADADRERREAAAARRKTPRSCGNCKGTNRKAKPKRQPGDRYRDTSFAKAVYAACDKAFPVPEGLGAAKAKAWQKEHRFHPHQLRHAAATRFRREHNLETARALLGQKSMKAAEVYAEIDMTKARDVMAVSG